MLRTGKKYRDKIHISCWESKRSFCSQVQAPNRQSRIDLLLMLLRLLLKNILNKQQCLRLVQNIY